ncbi:MAG: acetylornithine deacetylase/succinyl-diaminopimelate desuccinylase-like protein [Nonlabens sp.]|jgi:acetylornithine deacetylase/succinyl-diaminopimelate desuccinylase-like protein
MDVFCFSCLFLDFVHMKTLESKSILFIGLFFVLSMSSLVAQVDKKLSREIFKELIEINTTHSSGSTTVAAEAMAKRLRAVGFDDKDIFIGGPTDTKGNLVVRYRGNGSKKPVLLMAHLDVVEADINDWSFDPFKFKEADGVFYGRGIADDKAMCAIFVANFIRMKIEGFVPERDIIIALTADEEGGDHNGVSWLLDNHRELVDAEFALNEGAGGMEKGGKKVLNGVQLSEKVYQSFNLEIKNPGGHSSRPKKVNAIYQLANALTNLEAYKFPLDLNDGTKAYFSRSSNLESGQLAEDMMGITQTPPAAGAEERLSEDPYYNALLHTTCVATMLGGGHAENALPQTATAVVNCRILPGQDPAMIKAKLEEVFDNNAISVTPIREAFQSQPTSLDPMVMGPIEAITEKMWPGVPVIPTMSTGATDGYRARNAGIPVFGVSGIFTDEAGSNAHGQDERLRVNAYYEGQEFLYQVVKELTKPTSLSQKK